MSMITLLVRLGLNADLTYLTLAAMLSWVERRWHIKAYLLLAPPASPGWWG
jgi:hypothetical protein